MVKQEVNIIFSNQSDAFVWSRLLLRSRKDRIEGLLLPGKVLMEQHRSIQQIM
jgi:hypothetical protein